MITFRRMIYFLIFVIVVLSLSVVWISINFRNARRAHERKIESLNYIITALSIKNHHQSNTLMLSDDLRKKLDAAREAIDRDMSDLHIEFVETLAKNNLI